MKTNRIMASFGVVALMFSIFSFTTSRQIDTGKAISSSEWKNLKVLPQNISEDSLKGLMRGYNAALGVKCNFCHAENPETKKMDFASDAKKEKEFARHMIVMTRDINAKNFNWENSKNPEMINVVTCVMCHRGNESPTKSLIEPVNAELKNVKDVANEKLAPASGSTKVEKK
ncbi:c-type cytochrome [Empedobacter falsenii]|uniref:Photosynthetic reaction center cytochrome c subunit n=1 Tax=Empedobacter falsenii TaxID=343874 RepID=A0A376G490_9FLAO|nr:c-type cytochrome [Empedobacter falsenii]STD55134.1 Cytochrome c554 [Empedobacter falsenii]